MKQKENIKRKYRELQRAGNKCVRRSGGSERNIKAKVKIINVKRMRKDIMEIALNMNEKEEIEERGIIV